MESEPFHTGLPIESVSNTKRNFAILSMTSSFCSRGAVGVYTLTACQAVFDEHEMDVAMDEAPQFDTVWTKMVRTENLSGQRAKKYTVLGNFFNIDVCLSVVIYGYYF